MCLIAGSAAGPAAAPFPVVPDVVAVDAACTLAKSPGAVLHCIILLTVEWLALKRPSAASQAPWQW